MSIFKNKQQVGLPVGLIREKQRLERGLSQKAFDNRHGLDELTQVERQHKLNLYGSFKAIVEKLELVKEYGGKWKSLYFKEASRIKKINPELHTILKKWYYNNK